MEIQACRQFINVIKVLHNLHKVNKCVSLLVLVSSLQVPGLAEKRPLVLKGDNLFVRRCDANGKSEGEREYKGVVHNTCTQEVWLGFCRE